MVSPLESLRVVLNGTRFTGWKAARIFRSLETVSGSWEFTAAGLESAWGIPPGARVGFALGFQLLGEGFVDEAVEQFDKSDHSIAIRGRDLSGQLADCSALNEPGEWYAVELAELVNELASPFSVGVFDERGETTILPVFSLQTGETAWEAIERACRAAGVIATGTQFGVQLGLPGTGPRAAALIEGRNVISARLTDSHAERFATYVVKGQAAGTGFGELEAGAPPTAEARDAGVKLASRRLLVLAEGPVDAAQAQERAQWEAAFRAARGSTLEVVTPGWLQGTDGIPWTPGQLVPVRIPSLRLEAELLLRDVTLEGSLSSGTTARLVLCRPGAFTRAPVVEEENAIAASFGAESFDFDSDGDFDFGEGGGQ